MAGGEGKISIVRVGRRKESNNYFVSTLFFLLFLSRFISTNMRKTSKWNGNALNILNRAVEPLQNVTDFLLCKPYQPCLSLRHDTSAGCLQNGPVVVSCF